ncbi:wall-associated kinase, putative [Ricinus communis]|uniref:Wall-associated kinase, putative n=1 Tax=Ricinus communis TaxID=3988 RepID=B9S2Q8_RICCO|nr:wall-associated kinase, putative [Ricinus communis]
MNCDDRSDPPVPFLQDSNIKISNISIDGQLEILGRVSQYCYDVRGYDTQSIWLSSFSISKSNNKFTVIGCDSYAYLNGIRYIQGKNKSYSSGCITKCAKKEFVEENSCSGSGCCQIAIPDGLYNASITAYSFQNDSNVSKFNPCTYAFIVEENKFNFTLAHLQNIPEHEEFPMVLEWTIESEDYHCKYHAKKKKKNRRLIVITFWGTVVNARRVTAGTLMLAAQLVPPRVVAWPGSLSPNDFNSWIQIFVGRFLEDIFLKSAYDYDCILVKSPSLLPNVDECGDKDLNNCTHTHLCSNTDGNYTCHCPEGYRGDGRKFGTGCTRKELPLIVISLSVGIGFVVLVVASSWLNLFLKKKKLIKLKEKFFEQNGGAILLEKLSKREAGTSFAAKIFTAEELKKATNNYDESSIIGKGSFGTVHKGFLKVYEFITNGTLFDYIHNQSNGSALSWDTRLRIVAETAEALSYLHSAASVPIIHRDIKTTNILLDATHMAKVSDFGASRLVPVDETQLSTMVQGTWGYLDPEYLHTNLLTDKSDVYSFGVVLVELLTSMKALSFDRPEEERSLAMCFLSSARKRELFGILDSRIVNKKNKQQIEEVARLAVRCLTVKGEERPSMKEVATELEGLRKMEVHSWFQVNPEETEYLLSQNSNDLGHGNVSSASAADDSMKDRVVSSVGDGR